jgi:ABC-type iron transport system FetAB permease component
VDDIIGIVLSIQPEPWFNSRIFIPTLGMLLGNSISGIALGIRSFLTSIVERRDETEILLAFGATRWEATMPLLRQGVKIALLPSLNAMAVMGIISIPGIYFSPSFLFQLATSNFIMI